LSGQCRRLFSVPHSLCDSPTPPIPDTLFVFHFQNPLPTTSSELTAAIAAIADLNGQMCLGVCTFIYRYMCVCVCVWEPENDFLNCNSCPAIAMMARFYGSLPPENLIEFITLFARPPSSPVESSVQRKHLRRAY